MKWSNNHRELKSYKAFTFSMMKLILLAVNFICTDFIVEKYAENKRCLNLTKFPNIPDGKHNSISIIHFCT